MSGREPASLFAIRRFHAAGPARYRSIASSHPSPAGSSKSSGSQYAFKIRWKRSPCPAKFRTERQAVRAGAPVRLLQFHAVPGLFRIPEQLVQAHAPALMLHVPQQTAGDQQFDEPVHVGVLGEQRPVEPTGLVVLAVGVVVAVLRAPHFVTHDDHGHAQRKHGHRQEILDLAVAQLLDRGIVGRALHAAVPASVIVSSVAVVFAVVSLCLSL